MMRLVDFMLKKQQDYSDEYRANAEGYRWRLLHTKSLNVYAYEEVR